MRFYIDCPYSDKEEAKALGAKWDGVEKSWFYVAPQQDSRFDKWQTPVAPSPEVPVKQSAESQDIEPQASQEVQEPTPSQEAESVSKQDKYPYIASGCHADEIFARLQDDTLDLIEYVLEQNHVLFNEMCQANIYDAFDMLYAGGEGYEHNKAIIPLYTGYDHRVISLEEDVLLCCSGLEDIVKERYDDGNEYEEDCFKLYARMQSYCGESNKKPVDLLIKWEDRLLNGECNSLSNMIYARENFYNHKDIIRAYISVVGEAEAEKNIGLSLNQINKLNEDKANECKHTTAFSVAGKCISLLQEHQIEGEKHRDKTVFQQLSEPEYSKTMSFDEAKEAYPSLLRTYVDWERTDWERFSDDELKILNHVWSAWRKTLEYSVVADSSQLAYDDDVLGYYVQEGGCHEVGVKCHDNYMPLLALPNNMLSLEYFMVDKIDQCKTESLKQRFNDIRKENPHALKQATFAIDNYYNCKDIIRTYMSIANESELALFAGCSPDTPRAMLNSAVNRVLETSSNIELYTTACKCIPSLYAQQIRGAKYHDDKVLSEAAKGTSKLSDTKEKQHKPKSDYDER